MALSLAAARRVRWAPALVELREFSTSQGESCQQGQHPPQVVAATRAAGEGDAAAEVALEEIEKEQLTEQRVVVVAVASAGVDERRAVRAETGKRQAVAGVTGVATGAPVVPRKPKGLDVRPDAPRIRRPGSGKGVARAVSRADVLAWAAAHLAAHRL
jgi:hypothetical protein